MDKERFKQVWPEYEIEGIIGQGSYGTVVKVAKKEQGITTRSAIKAISIPFSKGELTELQSEGMTLDQSKTYYRGVVEDLVGEIRMMELLRGAANIVSIEDYKVIERTDEFGFDIYIKMELLTPLNAYICDKKLSEKEVAKLGMDICSALSVCEQKNIIHRDIKPENIFVNEFGDFKLGDFGIARRLENVTFGLSQKGTFNYMAPEMINSTYYNNTVDLYSLGVVLFKLLNGNRLPFLNTSKQLLSPFERKLAVENRLKGDDLPNPVDASEEMSKVILKACAFRPEDRYATADSFKEDLVKIHRGKEITEKEKGACIKKKVKFSFSIKSLRRTAIFLGVVILILLADIFIAKHFVTSNASIPRTMFVANDEKYDFYEDAKKSWDAFKGRDLTGAFSYMSKYLFTDVLTNEVSLEKNEKKERVTVICDGNEYTAVKSIVYSDPSLPVKIREVYKNGIDKVLCYEIEYYENGEKLGQIIATSLGASNSGEMKIWAMSGEGDLSIPDALYQDAIIDIRNGDYLSASENIASVATNVAWLTQRYGYCEREYIVPYTSNGVTIDFLVSYSNEQNSGICFEYEHDEDEPTFILAHIYDYANDEYLGILRLRPDGTFVAFWPPAEE